MEMESSRRSAMDRSREPGLKKARLADEVKRDRGSNGVAADRDRPFPPPRVSTGGQPLIPRFRASERERDEREDSVRGGGPYQPQQELVSQYKTAIAELTFNSKPIITNLTIIAGENLHAAKGIAATVCNNILEVPIEQKLPSLYLLDSIVKNIGRDYIKYFAARLPEVFCKAYKQVDSSTHPGMRHLFGTWKGVFPPAPLQIIEKELGFPPVINGSSGATASRPDSQAQRSPHSIHVNPKYLEARQRLQQSTRAKEINSEDTRSVLTPVDDEERPDRTTISGSARQWTDLPTKTQNIQRPQREQLNDAIREKIPGPGFRDPEFSSNPSRQSDMGVRRISEGIKERDGIDKPWYGADSTVAETPISRRNGFDVTNAYGNRQSSGSVQADDQLPSIHLNNANKSSRPTSKNWKNSEEEEYMWDDMNSRSTDYGRTNSSTIGGWNPDDADTPASLQRGKWKSLETDHLDSQRNKLDSFSQLVKTSGERDRIPLFREFEENLPQPRGQQDIGSRFNRETSEDLPSIGQAALGHHASSVWPSREPPLSVVGLNHVSLTSRISGQSDEQSISGSGGLATSLSLPRSGLLSHGRLSIPSSLGSSANTILGSSGTYGQQRQQLHPPSPSAHSPPSSTLPHQKSYNPTGHDHLQPRSFHQTGQKPIQLPGQLSRAPHAPVTEDSFPILAQNHTQQSRTLLNLQTPLSQPSQQLQVSSSSAPFTQPRHHLPFLQQSHPDLPIQQTQMQPQSTIQTQKPSPPPPSFGTHQIGGFSGTGHSHDPAADISVQSNTSDLLAAIMESGLIPNSSANTYQNLNIQPPLPSGPPPIQVLSSSAPLVTPSSLSLPTSHANTQAVMVPSLRAVLPPLPPGPPPPSSLVGTSSRIPNTASAVPNPLSSLLSSLVAKGLISSPAAELPPVTTKVAELPPVTSKIPNQLLNQSSGFDSSTSKVVPSTSATLAIPGSSSVKELSVSESSAPTNAALSQPTTTELNDLIGIDFKPEIIRELHPSVINYLFDDLKLQCNICGLRFKFQEQLGSHLDWHASEKSELSNFDRVSRKWYVNLSNWLAGNVGPAFGPSSATYLEEEIIPSGEKCEPMVPADESQSICALCGEPFEDFYSHERDEWMYQGTVYLNLPEGECDMGSTDKTVGQVHIVHAKCISRSSIDHMEVAEHDKEVQP